MSQELQTKQDLLTSQTVFLNVKGQIHDQNALAFKKSIFSIPEEKKFLVLDISSLQSLSGDGIRVFVESIKYFSKRNGKIILIQPKEEIFLLLKFLNLLNYVIVCEDYSESKEIIFRYLENTINSLMIEEKNLSFEKKNIQKTEVNRNGDLESIRNYFSNLKEQIEKINKKVEHYEEKTYNKEIFDILNLKLEEIKQSNESYLKELQIRIDSINESQESLLQMVSELKKEVQNIQNEITEIKQTSPTDQNVKKIDGFYIFHCPKCNQALRVKQWGKHLCPSCNAKLNILPDSSIEIFDSL